MTTATRLTAGQAATIEAARKVLTEDPPSMYELADTAARIDALEWQLDELLALVGQLTAGE